jgi:hypothetical protein
MDPEAIGRWVGLASDITTGFVLLAVIIGGWKGWYVWGRDHRAQLDRQDDAHAAALMACDETVARLVAERDAAGRELAELRAIVRDRARP